MLWIRGFAFQTVFRFTFAADVVLVRVVPCTTSGSANAVERNEVVVASRAVRLRRAVEAVRIEARQAGFSRTSLEEVFPGAFFDAG